MRTENQHSAGARRAGHSQFAYKHGSPGFYVANAFTGIVIDGPFDMPSKAEMAALKHEPPTMRVIELKGVAA